MPETETRGRWSRYPARSGPPPEPRPEREPLFADALIVDLGGGLLAEIGVANRTSRMERFWIGGEAVEEPQVADVDGNGEGKIVIAVTAGTLEVRHGGPTGPAIMVGEVPEPGWGSPTTGDEP